MAPMAAQVVDSHLGNEIGWWGKPSSTMNWCEEDYVVTPWVAEFWNTVSNLAFVVLVSLGAGVFQKGVAGHSLRFEIMASLGGLLLVGTGSAAFHGTLLWGAQLLDELPMIYASCLFISCLIHSAVKQHHGTIVVVGLAAYAVVVTTVYLRSRDFEFFLMSYSVQVVAIAGMSMYHCFTAPSPAHRQTLIWLLVVSVMFYFTGFFLWNIDNAYCPDVRRLRAALPAHLRPLLQLHALWHVLSAYGTFVSVVLAAYARAAADGLNPVLVTDSPVMYVRVARKDAGSKGD
eukprot:m.220041 g.220041  ORF g.220041 m.220041 type:complete len:288 (-) comp30816_c0_seq1:410-1273(-)